MLYKDSQNSYILSLGWTMVEPLVRSGFQYCPLVWYFCSQADMLAVECIQKRMLRMVDED